MKAIHYYEASHFIGLRVDGGRLEIVDVIGHGAEGEVLLARNVSEGEPGCVLYTEPFYVSAPETTRMQLVGPPLTNPSFPQAVKVISKLGLETKAVMGLQAEIQLQQRASSGSHAGVIKLHNVVDTVGCLFLVSTFCACGDLFDQIVKTSGTPFALSGDAGAIRDIIIQLVDVVRYLHEDKHIAHRDIKPENLYWDAEARRLTIGDFGLACEGQFASDFGNGTSFYASPEAVGYFKHIALAEEYQRDQRDQRGGAGDRAVSAPDDPRKYRYDAFASDIWSIGIVIINLSCERNPWQYAVPTNDEAFASYLLRPETFLKDILPDITDDCHALLRGILRINPEERMSLAEIRDAVAEIEAFTVTADLNQHERRITEDGNSGEGRPAKTRETTACSSWIDTDSQDCRQSSSVKEWLNTNGLVSAASLTSSTPSWLRSDAPLVSPALGSGQGTGEEFYSLPSAELFKGACSEPPSVEADASAETGSAPTSYRFPPTISKPTPEKVKPILTADTSGLPLLASAACSLTLSASTHTGSNVRTPVSEAGDPLRITVASEDDVLAADDQNKETKPAAIRSPLPSLASQCRSPAGVRALPLSPSAGMMLATPTTPTFNFNMASSPSPMSYLQSPLRHAQQAFLDKHYGQFAAAVSPTSPSFGGVFLGSAGLVPGPPSPLSPVGGGFGFGAGYGGNLTLALPHSAAPVVVAGFRRGSLPLANDGPRSAELPLSGRSGNGAGGGPRRASKPGY